MGDITYTLQGVDLTDQRWASTPVQSPIGRRATGVWELNKGTGLLPSLPGFRVTRFEKPGQHGETQAQFAPVAANGLPLVVRFWALGADPGHPDYQQVGATPDVRLRMLQENISEFLFRAQIGAAGSKGYLELERRYSPDGDPQTAVGRIVGSSEPEYGPDYLWADYTLIFSNPYGTWTGEQVTVTEDITTTSETEIRVPMGTAPVWDAVIAVRVTGEGERLEAGTRFTNDTGVGFEIARWTESWWIYDMASRMASLAGTASFPNWGANLNDAQMVRELGRPQGSALLINPGVAGVGDRVGAVKVTAAAPCQVRIRYRPRYF
jgi:hypothetical protein